MKEWEWPALVVDVAVTALLYKWYKEQRKTADLVQTTSYHPLDKSLAEGQSVDYAAVVGTVKPVGSTIRSMFGSDEGVIQNIAYIEHKTKKEGGFWRDTKNVIRDTYNERPFVLEGNSPTERIRVEEPLMADYLVDSLPVTHDRFEPNKANLLSRGLDRIFGDVSKGFQEKERLLPVGTTLLGYGKVAVEKGLKVLQPPDDPTQPYILTTQTKRQVIQSLQGSAKVYRMFAIMFSVAGVGIVGYIIYKQYRKWAQNKEMRALRREIEAGRDRADGDGPDDTAANRECVVCLQNRREVIMLECGHICTCFDCSQALPEPKKCPVCREPVVRIRNIYMP